MKTELHQLELNQKDVNCGMSYVFCLESGAFCIIDGGYFTDGEEDRLYDFLKSRSEGKPVIKGWFFTHAHQDHIGCFINFIEKYHDKVIIEKLMYNFQKVRKHLVFGSWKKKSNDLATVKHFYKVIDKYRDFFEWQKLKTGDRFHIEELDVEVLYTADDLYPEKASFNDYSAVFKIRLHDSEIMFLGDVQKKGSAILLKNKRDKLKSDFVQVAHHGFNGASKELYDAIDPEIVMLPAPDFEYEKNKEREVNFHLLNNLHVKETYVSGMGDCVFTFPYEKKSAGQKKKRYFFVTEK